jgi:hypothetical protein
MEAPVTPRRVESTLLVVEGFKDASGHEWRPGDRAPLARRAVREAARENPGWFRVEYSSEELDPTEPWFTAIVEEAEARYAQVKHRREGEAETREKSLREEMKQQQRGQPDFERRYREQEAKKAERLQQARDERERRQIEAELELGFMGFH